MTRQFRHHRASAVCAAVALTLVGCGGADDDNDGTPRDEITPEEIAAALSVEAIESRNLSADGNIGVAVTNVDDAELDIREVTLTAPPFPTSSATARGSLDAGRTVWYGVPQEEPDCESLNNYPDGIAPDDAYTVGILVGDEMVTMPVGRPEVYRRIADRVCGVEAVLAVVDVTFGPPAPTRASGAGGSIETTIELTRKPGTAVTVAVTGVRDTVQFALAGSGEPPLATLGPSDDTTSAPVTVTALRCDAHVLAEGKKNYLFGVFLSLDGRPDALVEIQAPEDLHAALVDVCDVH